MKRGSKERTREWDAAALHAYALRWLAYRARSEFELRQRLQRLGAAEPLVDDTVERLKAEGLVDDAGFAQAWIDSRRRASPRGNRLLRRELLQKGVPRPVVEPLLAAPERSEPALARSAAEKRARALAAEPEPVFVRRLTAFLLRRGFEYDIVQDVVRALAAERGRDA